MPKLTIRKKVKSLKQKQCHYLVNHPLMGMNCHFDSWVSLCEQALEVAEDEAKRQLNETLMELICKISDEIVACAQECEPIKCVNE